MFQSGNISDNNYTILSCEQSEHDGFNPLSKNDKKAANPIKVSYNQQYGLDDDSLENDDDLEAIDINCIQTVQS